MKTLKNFILILSICLPIVYPLNTLGLAEEIKLLASGTCGDDLTWRLTSSGTLMVNGTGEMTWYLDGEAPWYDYRDNIKNIIINSGMTNIGTFAFYNCSNLISVTIPTSVTTIGQWTFANCSSLSEIDLSENITSIGPGAFSGCTSLINIELPCSISGIGRWTFSGCTGLISIKIPNSVKGFGVNAFSGCSSLISVELPESVETITRENFYKCSNLNSIRILNGNCSIYDDPDTIYKDTIIYGHSGSTAQSYAEKYNRTFVPLDSEQENEIGVKDQFSALEQKALTLIKNTNGRENPLLEYSDPENLFCGYAMSLAAQSAVYVYGDEFSKNKLWVSGYERCLDALLAEDNLKKILSDCEISKFVEVVDNTKELIDMAITNKLSTMIKATDGVDLVNILKQLDSFVRAELQYYDGCIAILCQIMDNTNNENLKEACRVVMSDRYTFVIEEMEKQVIECFVENGIVLLEKSSEILGEFLAEYIALGASEIATVIASSAEALSYVKAVVVAKDIISEITGLRKRVENYLDAICLSTIYFASANSYNDSLKKINGGYYEEKDISNIISMFEFVVKVKQKQYDCMNNMFTPNKLQKIKAADHFIGQHIESLNKITIDNYSKVELQKLTPIVELKQSIKKGTKSNVRVTGIAYKGKVTYKSTNKKVAKVNSSGKVTAKKAGDTKIIVKIKQYGEELEIEKEVKVYK